MLRTVCLGETSLRGDLPCRDRFRWQEPRISCSCATRGKFEQTPSNSAPKYACQTLSYMRESVLHASRENGFL
jgi:hypothetical protein